MKSIKNTSKFHSPKLFILIAALLVLSAIPFIYVYVFNGSIFGWKASSNQASESIDGSEDAVDQKPATDSQADAGKNIKEDTVNNNPSGGSNDKDTSSSVNVTITAANQNGSNLQIRTLIEDVTATGKCTLTLAKGNSIVTRTAGVQALASASTCAGFDIPVSELSIGEWIVTIDFSNDNLSGSATKTITIK